MKIDRSVALLPVAVLAVGLLTSCGSGTAKPSAAPSKTTSAPAAETSPEPTVPEVYATVPEPSDFMISLKTKRKHCFGSAGCNVTVEPDLTYGGILPLDPDKTYSVTYEISGDDDGPVIDTIELSNAKSMRFYPQSLSTTSSGVKITAEVTDVEESG
jgi:hypothetical protein